MKKINGPDLADRFNLGGRKLIKQVFVISLSVFAIIASQLAMIPTINNQYEHLHGGDSLVLFSKQKCNTEGISFGAQSIAKSVNRSLYCVEKEAGSWRIQSWSYCTPNKTGADLTLCMED